MIQDLGAIRRGSPSRRAAVIIMFLCSVSGIARNAMGQTVQHEIHALKVTVLSTMLVGDTSGIGEWGFSALVEADGHRILVDTGARPDTVIRNAHDLHVDLSGVQEVVLTHSHWDHVDGLLALRRELMKNDPKALSIVHVSEGIFESRPAESGERNPMIAIRKEYVATGGRFVVHRFSAELIPGVWFTGPIPRVYPEHNWDGPGRVVTAAGVAEDNIPEDSSLVLNTAKGLVVVTGCGHAGIVNIVTQAAKLVNGKPIFGVVGGLHLFRATDETVDWTASKLQGFHLANLLAAHCTGIEATFRLRQDLGLTRKSAVVASVGSSLSLAAGIEAGPLAQ
ncbi:MBL fold metallo-hydrolase [Occallatibacter riparius]|uniref:MBL fold metallo-hydrolase n=1 Tax=Occallatibacter riparius TaxID=1002689 RepID=A0A9J7BJ13_9BACT|nr:MBL fold metallo-hydrolase [Occallatibacter riparius]UWZ82808.1 MBL fold metallo-hydrolase [Occallatibacter riparius]